MPSGGSMAYPPMWGSPLPYPPLYDTLTGVFGGLIPSMKFSGNFFGKRGSVCTPTLNRVGNFTPTFGSVGFLLYLCEMEPNNQVFVDYPMFGESDIQIYDDLYTGRIRYKMGGDEGVHSIVKNTEEDGD